MLVKMAFLLESLQIFVLCFSSLNSPTAQHAPMHCVVVHPTQSSCAVPPVLPTAAFSASWPRSTSTQDRSAKWLIGRCFELVTLFIGGPETENGIWHVVSLALLIGSQPQGKSPGPHSTRTQFKTNNKKMLKLPLPPSHPLPLDPTAEQFPLQFIALQMGVSGKDDTLLWLRDHPKRAALWEWGLCSYQLPARHVLVSSSSSSSQALTHLSPDCPGNP